MEPSRAYAARSVGSGGGDPRLDAKRRLNPARNDASGRSDFAAACAGARGHLRTPRPAAAAIP